MDSIMEKNLRTFASGFMQQQQDYAELEQENTELTSLVEEMSDLIQLIRLLIYDTKDMTNDERVEKIGNAINIFWDRHEKK